MLFFLKLISCHIHIFKTLKSLFSIPFIILYTTFLVTLENVKRFRRKTVKKDLLYERGRKMTYVDSKTNTPSS